MLGPRERLFEEVHHLAERAHLVSPTNDELTIDNFRSLRRQLAAKFPSEGIDLNPKTFRDQIQEALAILQTAHNTDLPVFESTDSPFSKIAKHPELDLYTVRFVTPTHELLRSFPDHHFPNLQSQGIDLVGDQLTIVIINRGNQQEFVNPTPKRVTPHTSSRIKNTVLLTQWILDPRNLII